MNREEFCWQYAPPVMVETSRMRADLDALIAEETRELREALENALANEGQDGCYLPILGYCKCWRCQARAAIAKAKGQ